MIFLFLQCLFGLFRNVFNTYDLLSLLGPIITLAKVITSGFFGVHSQTVFHVLQSDSTQYKSPSPKKRQRHSVDICTLHSHNFPHSLNLLHKKLENFYEKFSSPLHNNSNKQHTSTLPSTIYQCYELPIDSHKKPAFQSLQLHTFRPNKRIRSHGFSL